MNEPIAWRYRSIFNKNSWILQEEEPIFDNDQYIKEPLYAAPASHDATREALEEIVRRDVHWVSSFATEGKWVSSFATEGKTVIRSDDMNMCSLVLGQAGEIAKAALASSTVRADRVQAGSGEAEAPIGQPPALPSGWTQESATKAAWMINTLAITPTDEWRSKPELSKEFRALASVSADDGAGS